VATAVAACALSPIDLIPAEVLARCREEARQKHSGIRRAVCPDKPLNRRISGSLPATPFSRTFGSSALPARASNRRRHGWRLPTQSPSSASVGGATARPWTC
jgi:hypothetical protein